MKRVAAFSAAAALVGLAGFQAGGLWERNGLPPDRKRTAAPPPSVVASSHAASAAAAAAHSAWTAASSQPQTGLFEPDGGAGGPGVGAPELVKSQAPSVPPATGRAAPARVVVQLESRLAKIKVTPDRTYEAWTFDGTVPGPMVRARVGDVLEVHHRNADEDGLAHNIDIHAVVGPGGGAPATYAEAGETKVARFRLLQPGLFMYHCAAAPVPAHIANGMYGLVLVEPEEGLPPVDEEYYVMQGEIYAEDVPAQKKLEFDYGSGLDEHPKLVVFNGRQGALTDAPLMLPQGK